MQSTALHLLNVTTLAVGTASAASGALHAGKSTTGCVRLVSTKDCYIAIGATPVAAKASGMLLAAMTPEYLMIAPGHKVAALATSACELNIAEVY